MQYKYLTDEYQTSNVALPGVHTVCNRYWDSYILPSYIIHVITQSQAQLFYQIYYKDHMKWTEYNEEKIGRQYDIRLNDLKILYLPLVD
jgi:hypothetical protein